MFTEVHFAALLVFKQGGVLLSCCRCEWWDDSFYFYLPIPEKMKQAWIIMRRYYIQAAYAIPDSEKMQQEQASLMRIPDSFKKLIVVYGNTPLWRNEQGITVMNLYDFLMDANSLDK